MKKDISQKEYWRSLEQLADTPEFRKQLEREFPAGASEMTNSVSRRKFLALVGASLSLAGVAGCRRPVEKIIPYVNQPEEITPGIPQFYATSMPFGTDAYGLIVESHEGRPTKIEGNPEHPSTLGASNAFVQASILELYDPERSKTITQNRIDRSWSDFTTFWAPLYAEFLKNRGEGLAILCGSYSSPTISRLRRAIESRLFESKWITYDAVGDETIFEGIKTASGSALKPRYKFENAKTILALDSDFLHMESGNISNTKGFAARRNTDNDSDVMNRLYVVESGFSTTGSMADHRYRMQSRQIGAFTAALALELRRQGLRINGLSNINFGGASAIQNDWIKAVAKDLINSRGESIVIAGRRQPPGVHALVYAINEGLGSPGNTIEYREPRDSSVPDNGEFIQLVNDMRNGRINTLVILDSNPVYNSPADLSFENVLDNVQHVIHMGTYVDETAMAAEWHIPQAHYLESWGDTRCADGTASVIQPLIEPLFGGKTAAELLYVLSSNESSKAYDIVRDTWRSRLIRGGDFEKVWRKVLHDGLYKESAVPPVKPGMDVRSFSRYLNSNPPPTDSATSGKLEIVFQESRSTFDGRFANNGWLQELPDPITKLTWDNAALISPKTAEELGLHNSDVVSLSYDGRKIEMPVWILPGPANNSVSVFLGYGRSAAGSVGNSVGVNAYLLRGSSKPNFDSGLIISKTGSSYTLASTQDHWSLEGRPHVREADLEDFRQHPEFAKEMVEHPPLESMWKEHSYENGYQWGMAIDLNKCTGCNVCVIACQSENNIPVVGKEQILNGREMHWMRIDRYFAGKDGNIEDPEVVYQPMACQNCEMAPCEQVCPVAATVHDKEGLNNMVYNRCIGTRYCSNNCPFKVRRFNFFNYTKETPEVRKMANNPEVTVRSRGVMEKCTYCVQRIVRAKHTAKLESRKVADGEILTACQQSCPADAIVFGNINDPGSKVSRIKQLQRDYEVLAELNIKPRTSYQAKIRNPNPEIE